MTAEQNLPKESCGLYCKSLYRTPHPKGKIDSRANLLEVVITSVHTLAELASKTFYFSLFMSAFAFVSILLFTGLHP
jgi:hypothetical protein